MTEGSNGATCGQVILNGLPVEIDRNETISSLLERRSLAAPGCAVARNAEVVPRSAWSTTALGDGDRVEVLAPAPGG